MTPLYIVIENGCVFSKMHDKRDDFDFGTIFFPFWNVDIPRRAHYCVYISELILFAIILRTSTRKIDA